MMSSVVDVRWAELLIVDRKAKKELLLLEDSDFGCYCARVGLVFGLRSFDQMLEWFF